MTSRLPRSVRPLPPGPGQESVWDYPRPPALELWSRHVVVRVGDSPVAESRSAWRVMETSHPPTWYVPRVDVRENRIRRSRSRSATCEWKGAASYWDVAEVDRGVLTWREAVAWSYESPTPRFVPITGFLSFMPGAVDCFIDGEQVRPQSGGFYGGWITSDVVGPFKGEPGSWGW
ncbi:MAG TPA: DUF427 domain-containing protein [Nakamurella sp.]|nr:DUF427 domain-containing protein [Nakamurella sp.]